MPLPDHEPTQAEIKAFDDHLDGLRRSERESEKRESLKKEQSSANTFGDYIFPRWIPEDVERQIRNFWGCFNRTYKDWIENRDKHVVDFCSHGPNPNGFGKPPFGARCMYINNRGEKLEGRYVHAWNNMGRLVHDDGRVSVVSSCDPWIRIFMSEEEMKTVLNSPRLHDR